MTTPTPTPGKLAREQPRPQAGIVSQSPQRAHPRYAHEAAITLHGAGIALEGRTRNVSRGGLCADLADPIEIGTELEVDIQLVFEGDLQSEPLSLPARVVWCTSVDDAHQVGLSFKPLSNERTEDLTLFLRYLRDSVSGKVRVPRGSIDDQFG